MGKDFILERIKELQALLLILNSSLYPELVIFFNESKIPVDIARLGENLINELIELVELYLVDQPDLLKEFQRRISEVRIYELLDNLDIRLSV